MASVALIPLAFYQRISPRERVLVLAVAGTAFLLANLWAVSTLTGAFRELRRTVADQSTNLQVQRLFASDQPKWAQRMQWLRQKQPVLASRDRAGASLLDQIQQLARGSVVLISTQKIKTLSEMTAEHTSDNPDYQEVAIEITTQSDWSAITKFIQSVQRPENFLVFNAATVSSDTDPATIKGHFEIAKWYAPANR